MSPSTAEFINNQFVGQAKKMGFGELHFKFDNKTGLFAIVAIHNTKLGPALGGCRFRRYQSADAAIEDVMRLAWGMTYKAAITNLPLGGGKAVLVKPDNEIDRRAYFETFGKFINDLGGRYITAVDSGTNTQDMDYIATQTHYVTSMSAGNGDPSPFTAHGVFRAMEAAAKFKLNKNSLEGCHVAIQGVGHVGYYLAKELHELGVKLTVADKNEEALQHCANDFNAQVVDVDAIYSVPCDIFSPCALGAIINDQTIPQLQTSIVVGSANNQLQESHHGEALRQRGITYGPDYVVNAGGLIHACAQYYKTPPSEVHKQVKQIYDTTFAIFERAERENLSTHLVADRMAEEKLAAGD